MFSRLFTVIALSALAMVMAQHAPIEGPSHGGKLGHKRGSAKPNGRGGQVRLFKYETMRGANCCSRLLGINISFPGDP